MAITVALIGMIVPNKLMFFQLAGKNRYLQIGWRVQYSRSIKHRKRIDQQASRNKNNQKKAQERHATMTEEATKETKSPSITIYAIPGSQFTGKVLAALDAYQIDHYCVFVPTRPKDRRSVIPSGGTQTRRSRSTSARRMMK